MFYSLQDLYAAFKQCKSNAAKVNFLQQNMHAIQSQYIIYVNNLIKLYS